MLSPTNDKRLVIDLDGTLCEQTPGGDYYRTAKPKQAVIDLVNHLWEEGWHVTIHTARGMQTFNGNVEQVRLHLEQLTIDWLLDHGVCFDVLMFGKPPATYYVDDKGLNVLEFLSGDF